MSGQDYTATGKGNITINIIDGYTLIIETDGYTVFSSTGGNITIGSGLIGATGTTTINAPISLTNQNVISTSASFVQYLEITINSTAYKIPLYI